VKQKVDERWHINHNWRWEIKDYQTLQIVQQPKGRGYENRIKLKWYNLVFDLELESGIVINPVLENEAHYRYWLVALPFYDNVEKEGIVIG
jgi:hypothetical protein